MSTLGYRIKKVRESLNLTGEEFGKKLNVTKVAVSNWENNNRKPDTDMLVRIAELGNVTTDYLLGRNDINLQVESQNDRLQKAITLKDEIIEMMIRRGIIKNKEDINEDHLKLIEMSIKTYADSTNNRRKDDD